MLNNTLKLKINNISNRLTFTCRNCIYLSVMFFLYCTEIAMFRFRGRSGISDYKKLFYAILLLKRLQKDRSTQWPVQKNKNKN